MKMCIALHCCIFKVLHLSSVKHIDVCTSEIFSFLMTLLSPVGGLSVKSQWMQQPDGAFSRHCACCTGSSRGTLSIVVFGG